MDQGEFDEHNFVTSWWRHRLLLERHVPIGLWTWNFARLLNGPRQIRWTQFCDVTMMSWWRYQLLFDVVVTLNWRQNQVKMRWKQLSQLDVVAPSCRCGLTSKVGCWNFYFRPNVKILGLETKSRIQIQKKLKFIIVVMTSALFVSKISWF